MGEVEHTPHNDMSDCIDQLQLPDFDKDSMNQQTLEHRYCNHVIGTVSNHVM